MTKKFDEIDKRIIYRLSQDARNKTASEIAEEMNVSPGTVRNRVRQLEEKNIIKGYHSNIDYERLGNKLTNLFKCSFSVQNREETARKALQIPGVINVRVIMAGHGGLHIKAVGEDTEDLAQIAEKISNLGIEIEDEDLIQQEYFRPYQPFGPEDKGKEAIIGFRKISENAEAVDIAIDGSAAVADKNLEEINNEGLITDDSLIVAIERENKTLTPRGNTQIIPGDIVTIFSSEGISEKNLKPFAGGEKINLEKEAARI
ncbi:AsnC family transcriptional regulator [candidate division MSBL1 archaeon SCGC-AAA382C18]|uniref:AsnC family transcriptional regulator n=1 Tax=candidate division MSBL1 archaeon SCGC-AAA382C18 TaxID=1698281 RepID=A0A133VHC9_9EURY|nr:AsnC family transcriptional regulator [candidate division MSBL1 archaeon SCGC-AAA382C18]